MCVIKNGLSGEIEVNGKKYNRPMPANQRMADIDIATIATFVYNKWGKDTTYIPIDSVKAALSDCKK